VIGLALRLTVAGGREAVTRLTLIVVAVAIGVGLLLATVAGLNAVHSQNDRYAWLETGFAGGATSAGPAGDPIWWRLRADRFDGNDIGQVDLAATGANPPLPPGMTALPGPGEYYASPAMAALLRRIPAAELADRYPGRLIGTIGSAALPSPDTLVIVIGHTAAELSHQSDAELVNRISTTAPDQCAGAGCAVGVGTNANGITLILAVVAAALLFPVLLFIGNATRLSAARREQRLAAMRLVGATPRQTAVVSTVESSLAAAVGTAFGFAMFFAARPAIAGIPFTGARFFVGDLSLNLIDVLAVGLGIPVAAALAARLALRRVTISPLGVTRRVTTGRPRAWRLLPLLAGIAELWYFAYIHDIGAHTGTNSTVEAVLFLAGVLLVMIGLVVTGPWLTMLASRCAVRHARRPTSLIAARRLADDPKAGFRAISGLVLAVFVGTCATAIITTIVAYTGGTAGVSGRFAHTVVDQLGGPDAPAVRSVSPATISALDAIPGVTGVAVIRTATAPAELPPPTTRASGHTSFTPVENVVSCADLAQVPALGRCLPGTVVANIVPDYGGGLTDRLSLPQQRWHAADVSTAELATLPVDSIAVGTTGTSAAAEQARTVLGLAYPRTFPPDTIGEIQSDQSRLLNDYRRLAEVVVLTSLPIAGCGLAVSIAGGLAERRRPFSMLRLAGTPVALLRRIIGLETAAPMLVTALGSIGAGMLAAHLFVRAQLGETLQAPGGQYYVLVGLGLLAALAIIASTLPLLNRMTGPDVARND
jgi:hypothetical protein